MYDLNCCTKQVNVLCSSELVGRFYPCGEDLHCRNSYCWPPLCWKRERPSLATHYHRPRMEEAEGERKRWALKRGVRMGKQVLVASLLASSAPVVIPPLVVVSVIGISVFIPFGLFWASHACTHKLMSKLLPMPATPCYVHVEMEYPAADDQRNGDGKKEDPRCSEHIKQVDESDIVDSHKPIPSVVMDDETIGLRQESCGLVMNDVVDVQNSSRSGPVMSPNNNEVTVNEEKLLKEINAIRVIVGYEGTQQASCMDELRKLYIVAGVEPPFLLDASCSSCAIHDHLQFLMSILGVKSNGP